MRRSLLLLPFCLATVALAGCGNKGPLYLPAKPVAPASVSAPAGNASTATPAVATPAASH